MIRCRPGKLTPDSTNHGIKVLADKPIFSSVPQSGMGSVDTSKKPIFDFTCYVTETSVESKESFCPNFKTFFTLYCEKCDKYYVVPVGCHQRTCSFCAARRKKQLIWKYIDNCRDMQNPKLFTFTAPWFSNPRKGCAAMRAAFRRLRQRSPFKNLFKKGLYGFHIKAKPGGMWYVHIHALIDTKYVPQHILSSVWAKCMPGAFVTDIRKAWSPKGGLKYILDYITAPPSGLFDENEFNAVMKGTRLVSTIGNIKACQLPACPFICPYCGTASYGLDHRTKHHIKWHNFGRKRTRQEAIIDYG